MRVERIMVTWEQISIKHGKQGQRMFKSSYQASQDCTEVDLNGIAARYIVTVISKKDVKIAW